MTDTCYSGKCAVPGMIQFKIVNSDGTIWANVVCPDCVEDALTDDPSRTAIPISKGGSCIRCGRRDPDRS